MKRAAIVFMLSSLACIVAFEVIGSEVNEDGTLVEPFFLLPIAWLLFVTGGILAIATFIKGRLK
jgi:hypothetical protein